MQRSVCVQKVTAFFTQISESDWAISFCPEDRRQEEGRIGV